MVKKKSNMIIYVIIGILVIFLILFTVLSVQKMHNTNNENNDYRGENEYDYEVVEATAKPFDDEEVIMVNINNENYKMTLYNNQSSFDLYSVIPIELEMNDLNNNEKYQYLNFSLSDNSNYTGKISKGDVMLYQSNCIVIFYKDIETDYYYTKLGHIDDLPDFDGSNIIVKFNK